MFTLYLKYKVDDWCRVILFLIVTINWGNLRFSKFPSRALLPRDNLTRRSNACGPFRRRYKKTYLQKSEIRMKTSNPGKCLDSLILSHQVTNSLINQ